MSRDPTVDRLTVERWRDLAEMAELPALDASVVQLALANASGPGDAALRLVVEAVAVRRRRTPRVTRSAAGEVAVIFDPLGTPPPGVSRAVVARERRRACAKIARAARYYLGLPLATLAPALGVSPRSLQRWCAKSTPGMAQMRTSVHPGA
jgi:hypothetical protein